jgi:tRNA 2-thiouridine synthesizing protein A
MALDDTRRGPHDVDARGHRCPTPTLRLQRALRGASVGGEVRLLADDPLARIDVPHFVQQNGHELVSIIAQGEAWMFVIRKGAASRRA